MNDDLMKDLVGKLQPRDFLDVVDDSFGKKTPYGLIYLEGKFKYRYDITGNKPR
jgi:hypothetical protein